MALAPDCISAETHAATRYLRRRPVVRHPRPRDVQQGPLAGVGLVRPTAATLASHFGAPLLALVSANEVASVVRAHL